MLQDRKTSLISDPAEMMLKTEWRRARDGLLTALDAAWEPGSRLPIATRVAMAKDALEALLLLRELVPARVLRGRRADTSAARAAYMQNVAARRAARAARAAGGKP